MSVIATDERKNIVQILQDENLLREQEVEKLVRIVKDPKYSKEHTYLEFRSGGKASTVTGDSSRWQEVQWQDKKRRIPTYNIGVSITIPFEKYNWLEEENSLENLENQNKEQLREALGKKQIDLLINGVREGSNIVRYGLINQPEASKISIDTAKASVKDLVEATIQAKALAIKKGARNEKGFEVIFPLSLENKIKEYFNTAGTETGLSYLQNQYNFLVKFSQYITKPIFFQAYTGDMYFHRFQDVVMKNTTDPHSGSTRIFAQMAGAWLVVPFAERIVYLES